MLLCRAVQRSWAFHLFQPRDTRRPSLGAGKIKITILLVPTLDQWRHASRPRRSRTHHHHQHPIPTTTTTTIIIIIITTTFHFSLAISKKIIHSSYCLSFATTTSTTDACLARTILSFPCLYYPCWCSGQSASTRTAALNELL